MTKYYLHVSQPRPSMNEDTQEIEASDYQDAVKQCHEVWREVKRAVSLHTTEYSVYHYHYVDYKGNATDRNTNSGVPQNSVVTA